MSSYRVNQQKSNFAQIALERSNEGISHLALASEQIDLASNRFVDPGRPRLKTIILPRHDPIPSKHGRKDAYIYQEVPGRSPRQYVPYRANLEHGHHLPHFPQMHGPPNRRDTRPHHHGHPRQFQNNQHQQFEQRFFPQRHFPHPRFRSFPPRQQRQHFQENRNDRNYRDFQEQSFSRQRDLREAQREFPPRKNETPSLGSSHSSFVFRNSPDVSPKRSFPQPPTPPEARRNFPAPPKPPTPITPLEKSLRTQKGYSQFYKETEPAQSEETSEAAATPETKENVAVPRESLADVEHEDSVPIVPLKSENPVSIPAIEPEAPVLCPIPRNRFSLSRSPKENDPKRSPSFYTASEYSQSFDSFKTATSYGSHASILDFDNCVDGDQLKRKQWKREFSIRNNSEKLTEVLNVMEQLQNNTPLEEIRKSSESLSPDAVLEKMNKFQDDSTLE